MMAAATAHPRGPACAPGSIETSGSKTVHVHKIAVPSSATARDQIVALCQLFHGYALDANQYSSNDEGLRLMMVGQPSPPLYPRRAKTRDARNREVLRRLL